MRSDLRKRLRELGLVRGVRELAELPPSRRVPIETIASGYFHTTEHGRCFVAQEVHPPEKAHGSLRLGAFLELPLECVARIDPGEELEGVDLQSACFIDTETTGLSGGTGTMAFVVGLGIFTDEGFCVRQYFLRDPGDEPAMIEALAGEIAQVDLLVSFNGRAFDVPILENRFILARTPPPTSGLAHLDLLPASRRLWRYHLPSCSLGTIEREKLGVRREQADVPGGVIPTIYRDYLRTGDAREMKRVLYHNAIDVLSLVTLTARLSRAFADPWQAKRALRGGEFYGLGRWYTKQDQARRAERAYRSALGSQLPDELRQRTLRDLAYLLKRADRRDEAFAYWQQLALEETDRVLAHVEIAKYFEWHVERLALAAAWTRAAVARVEHWPSSLRREHELETLHHRLARLERKLGNSDADVDAESER